MASAASLLMKRLRNSTGGRGKEKRQQSQHQSFQNEDEIDELEIFVQKIAVDTCISPRKEEKDNLTRQEEVLDHSTKSIHGCGSDIRHSGAKGEPVEADLGIVYNSSAKDLNMDEATFKEPQGWSQEEDICVYISKSSDEQM